MKMFEVILDELVGISIHGFELVGVVIIILSGVHGFVNYVRKDPKVRLQLAQGMAMGLEFKLGSEILRTVVVRELSEVALVAAIIAVRAALTFLIHWEIKTEDRNRRAGDSEKRRSSVILSCDRMGQSKGLSQNSRYIQDMAF